MCVDCFTHILADARLRDETATCPSCRVEISKSSAIRNLAVENAVSELPSECQFCDRQFPRNSLRRHEETECEERWDTTSKICIILLCDTWYIHTFESEYFQWCTLCVTVLKISNVVWKPTKQLSLMELNVLILAIQFLRCS